MQRLAAFVRALDPRLKMGIALVLGPSLWQISPVSVALCGLFLLLIVRALAMSQPLGSKMIRSLFTFIFIWVGIKVGVDLWSAQSVMMVFLDGGDLALRLASLLLLGLALSLSTSARALGLAVSWAIRPVVGRERAWRLALSLSLMVHFLPLCLSTINQVKETLSRRCPGCGIRQRMVVIAQAVIRNLGQKTWNQTLAVAGRGLENGAAWEPDFMWTRRDSASLFLAVGSIVSLFLLSVFFSSH